MFVISKLRFIVSLHIMIFYFYFLRAFNNACTKLKGTCMFNRVIANKCYSLIKKVHKWKTQTERRKSPRTQPSHIPLFDCRSGSDEGIIHTALRQQTSHFDSGVFWHPKRKQYRNLKCKIQFLKIVFVPLLSSLGINDWSKNFKIVTNILKILLA